MEPLFSHADEIHWSLDFALKTIASLGAVVGGILTLRKYLDEKKKANETAKLESQRPFSIKQQEVYFDLLKTTSIIATRETVPAEDPVRQKAIADFWEVYWGPLPVVATQEVAKAADDFTLALAYPQEFVPLRNASMDLARACRRSLGESWSIGLDDFDKSETAIAKTPE